MFGPWKLCEATCQKVKQKKKDYDEPIKGSTNGNREYFLVQKGKKLLFFDTEKLCKKKIVWQTILFNGIEDISRDYCPSFISHFKHLKANDGIKKLDLLSVNCFKIEVPWQKCTSLRKRNYVGINWF